MQNAIETLIEGELLGPVFGISNAYDADLCSEMILNEDISITDGIEETIYPGGAWCSDNDAFELDGNKSDWLIKDINDDYFGVVNDHSSRTILMGEFLGGIWGFSEQSTQLNVNAVKWMMDDGWFELDKYGGKLWNSASRLFTNYRGII